MDLDGAEIVHEDALDSNGPATTTPADVTQVWVATRVLDTPSHAPKYTFRSSEGKFLKTEHHGELTCFSEARGPLEEWKIVQLPGATSLTFGLQGANGQLVALDVTAGGKYTARCDSILDGEQVDPQAEWHIQLQWKFRHEARKKEIKEAPLHMRDPSFQKRVRHE